MGKRPQAKKTAKSGAGKPSAKSAAAKKPAPTKTPPAKAAAKPAPPRTSTPPRRAVPATDESAAARYTPKEVPGVGWRPFRYPPE